MRTEKRVLQNNAVQKGKIMAKKTNMVNDDNIGNFKHERRNELPLERFKQTAGNEVANSILDAYDNARDRKADNRQQEQRIRDYQQEREKTGRNSEQLHFQRNYDVYDAGFGCNSGESAPMQQSYSENTSSNSSQYTGSARTDSVRPSSRVSSGTESRMPVPDAGNRYTNPTIDNSSLNAMSSEGQRLSRTETPSYEAPQRTSPAQMVYGSGNISGGSYVPPQAQTQTSYNNTNMQSNASYGNADVQNNARHENSSHGRVQSALGGNAPQQTAYTGSARTDSARPSSRVSSGTESRMPVPDAGNRYTNPTIDNSSLNAMSSEGQRLSRTETPSYEAPQRISPAHGVYGNGNVSGGSYVPPQTQASYDSGHMQQNASYGSGRVQNNAQHSSAPSYERVQPSAAGSYASQPAPQQTVYTGSARTDSARPSSRVSSGAENRMSVSNEGNRHVRHTVDKNNLNVMSSEGQKPSHTEMPQGTSPAQEIRGSGNINGGSYVSPQTQAQTQTSYDSERMQQDSSYSSAGVQNNVRREMMSREKIQPSASDSHVSQQAAYTGSARTDSARPSLRVSSGAENQYVNHTVGKSNLNVMSSEGQKLSRTEEPLYEALQRTSPVQGVRGSGNISGGSYVQTPAAPQQTFYTGDSAKPSSRVSTGTESRMPASDTGHRHVNPAIDNSRLNVMSSEGQKRTTHTAGMEYEKKLSGGGSSKTKYRIDNNFSQIVKPNENVPLYNIGDKTFSSAKEQMDYFSSNSKELLKQTKGENGLSINGRQYNNMPNTASMREAIAKSVIERKDASMIPVKTASGILMVSRDELNKIGASKMPGFNNLMNGNNGNITPGRSKGGGIGGNSRTGNLTLENNRFGITDGTNPDTMDMSHDSNAVINPGADNMPIDIMAPVKATFKQSDVYQGYKTLKTVRNTFRGSGKRQATSTLNAYGFERTKGVGIKKDIQNKLALNERSLNMLAVNVANLNISSINQILRTGMFDGQRLTNDQLKLLSERADLLKARNEINSRQGYNLLNTVVDNTFMQADVVQGARMAKTSSRVAAKGTNIALSAPTAAVGKMVSGTARVVGSERLGKFGQVIGDFSSSSLTGKAKMVGKGSAKIVGKGAKAAGRATVRIVGRTAAGQATGRAVVRAKAGLNSARVRVGGGLNKGRARVVNSRAGQAVSRTVGRIAGFKNRMGARASALGARVGNSAFVRGVRNVTGRIGALNRSFVRTKNRAKEFVSNAIRRATKGLRVAAMIILLVVTLVTCIPSAFLSIVSAQGSTCSSNSKSDEPPLMQQVVADMYKIQTSVEDDLRDGSGDSGIEPNSVKVVYNGKTLKDGLSRIGLSSVMKGVSNLSTNGLKIKYTAQAERVNTKSWKEYSKKDDVEKILRVKPASIAGYQALDSGNEKYKNRKVKIYYRDFCIDDVWQTDFMSFKWPAVISNDKKSYTPEGAINGENYVTVTESQLAVLDTLRWKTSVSGGAPDETTKTEYTPAGYYTSQTVYGPANSDGQKDGSYVVPTKKAGEKYYRADASFTKVDPEIGLKFKDENGNVLSANQLYKAICAAASAGTHNTTTDKDYYEAWCEHLMLWMLGNGDVVINIDVSDDDSTKFSWYGYEDADIIPCDGNQITGYGAEKFANSKKGDRILYSAKGKKLTVSVDYVVSTSFDEILKKGDNLDYNWQKEHSTEKCPWKEKTWKGFHNDDGTLNDTGKCAQAWYEMDDTAYSDMGVIFPGNTYPILSDAKIDNYIEQIKAGNGGSLSAQRESVIRAGLKYVGRFVYTYGGGHGSYPSKETAAATVGNCGGVDCSGFISFVTNQGGVFHHSGDTGYTAQGACDFAHFGKATSKGALKPGDIVVKNSDVGGSTTSNNHVVIYGGKFDTGDGAGVIDRFIECTTTSNSVDGQDIQECSGSQITKKSRSDYIFRKYAHYRNPYGD